MKYALLLLIGVFCAFYTLDANAIDKNSILGTWSSTDSTSGKSETVIFSATHFSNGSNTNIPYFSEQNEDVLEIYIGNRSNPPASFRLTDEKNGEIKLPNGRIMSLTRISTDTGLATASKSAPAPAANPMAAAFPNGVMTSFAPMGQSMEALLSSGWELKQISGAQNSMTALLVKGNSNALCILIPMSMAKGSTAISDCRKLN